MQLHRVLSDKEAESWPQLQWLTDVFLKQWISFAARLEVPENDTDGFVPSKLIDDLVGVVSFVSEVISPTYAFRMLRPQVTSILDREGRLSEVI